MRHIAFVISLIRGLIVSCTGTPSSTQQVPRHWRGITLVEPTGYVAPSSSSRPLPLPCRLHPPQRPADSGLTPICTDPIYLPTAAPTKALPPGLDPEPGEVGVVPTHAVRSITAEVSADGHQLAQDGPHVAFIDGTGVELVDLRDASKILVARTSDGDVPWWIDLSGDNLVWLAGGFDGGNDSHCDGAMSWRINVFNLANASTKKLASGDIQAHAGL